MKRSSRSCLSILTLLLVAGLCLVALAAAGFLIVLPERAVATFGPPDPGLNPLQRAYLSAQLLLEVNDLTLPADPYGLDQQFEIALGESPLSIAARLEQAGLISSAEAFRDYLVYAGLDTTLQAGEYSLSPRLSPVDMAKALQDATPAEVSFAILPGWRLEEIAASLPTSGLAIQPEVFLEMAQSVPPGIDLGAEIPSGASLEGFLLPDTYRLDRTLGAAQLISVFLRHFQEQVDADLRQGFERQELSLYQAVTLASIVEREAVSADEMPLIASVFINRLAAGMKLDSDPTVQYALGYDPDQDTWWTNPLSSADLQVTSPYNTYQAAGLPPGPIANPSLSALRAVAFPAQSPYYFFRARCDDPSKHDFSETFEEHLQKSCP